MEALGLTLDEPVFGSSVVCVQKRSALRDVIRSFIQHAIFEALAQDVDDLVVDALVTLELSVGFENADLVVCVALVDGWNATELLVVPWILFTVRLDDFFCGREKITQLTFCF